MDLSIKHIQHTGIPVTDIDRSIAFYEKLGFHNCMATTFPHGEQTGRVTMMKQGSVIIELYQLPHPAVEEIRQRGNGHIDHIAFDVEDIDSTFRVLKENGFTVMEEAPVQLDFWEKGCRYFNITGPDGERLEFNQIL